MEKSSLTLNDRKLVGISVRTSLQNELNPVTAKITPTVGRYMMEDIPSKIRGRKNPGIIHCCYHEYEDEYRAGYTFFIGEEVETFTNQEKGLSNLLIPAGHYTKFTTESGPMPLVIIGAWQKIWMMGEDNLGGKRRYAVDFEIYDERAKDPQNTIVDIYLGLQK